MKRDELADLTVFVAVAQEQSFTRAALRLGMSQSALSQIMRRLEERVGLRLLSRTTRSVAPTAAGEDLLRRIAPMLEEMDHSLTALGRFRDRPAGRIRITTVEHAAKTIILPGIRDLLHENPDINIEVMIDYGLSDIVADRFDAGVRLGAQVEKDMIAVPISPDIPMAIVGSPAYLKDRPAPAGPHDLIEHRCINLHLPSSGTTYAWPLLGSDKQELTRVRVEGPLTLNAIDLILDAARDGHGLAYLPLDVVHSDIGERRLVSVMQGRVPDLPGYHLYYANRRNASPAFRLLVEALRWRGEKTLKSAR
ncbi:DNA-binding transcriptional regulator, LysR family [Paracoccus isoporae]|uniref:DNA-binding transcriptional regulator, LysR family n=1 Tax=Paracoccus isoporae TaxID=591205 RepID=A0A1G6WMD2_9RHOB|nr:LysR family transcriptional regulator [Paracoccus isoporae]SDD66971.1 DNA-binding transcriptional regulator, LysR family [Paracoccus isoporae]